MKFCKDCKHYYPFDSCSRQAGGVDLVTGAMRRTNDFASSQRTSSWLVARMFNDCGKEARFFTPKEKK